MSQMKMNRRSFIQSSAVSSAAVGGIVSRLEAAPAPIRSIGNLNNLKIGFVGPGGRGFRAHVRTLSELAKEGADIELTAVCDVYTEHNERAAGYIAAENGKRPAIYTDYREMYEKEDLDAVCIGTPDHWHARQIIDAMNIGCHVYCEKPMTKSIDEALEVVRVWKRSGKVMQVGVQSTSLPVWQKVQEMLHSGFLGKVLMYQTEYFRNSTFGQWRHYKLEEKMSPKTINWDLWLGSKEGLAEDIPFDRAVFAQWRRFWPFGAGMYTDLFVHRTTSMLKATGLRFPGRVVGSGGIYLEYDGRDVPDVATVVAEFNEGVQGLVTATMCCQETPIRQLIRGHYGSFVFGNGERFSSFEHIPESERILGKPAESQQIEVEPIIENTTRAHFINWLDAIQKGSPSNCNNPPDLGAAAMVIVNLGARSYREGKVFHFDPESSTITEGNTGWARKWENMSKERKQPKHISGWKAGDRGSTLEEPEHMRLAGPWFGAIGPENS